MRKPIVRALAEGLDSFAASRAVSRAAVGRRAGIDSSTLWRAVHRGDGRATTMADFAEAVAAMTQDTAVTSEVGRLVAAVAAWVGDRRGGDAPEEALARLTEMSTASQAFWQDYGPPGRAFVALANSRALNPEGFDKAPSMRAALAALTLLMMDGAA